MSVIRCTHAYTCIYIYSTLTKYSPQVPPAVVYSDPRYKTCGCISCEMGIRKTAAAQRCLHA